MVRYKESSIWGYPSNQQEINLNSTTSKLKMIPSDHEQKLGLFMRIMYFSSEGSNHYRIKYVFMYLDI